MQELLKWIEDKYEITIAENKKEAYLIKEKVSIITAWENGALCNEIGIGFTDGILYFEDKYLNDAGSR